MRSHNVGTQLAWEFSKGWQPLGLCFSLMVPLCVMAQEVQPIVGSVHEWTGVQNDLNLKRENGSVEDIVPPNAKILRKGDQVCVLKEGSTITLNLGGNTPEVVGYDTPNTKDHCYKVTEGKTLPPTWDKVVVAMMGEWWDDIWKQQHGKPRPDQTQSKPPACSKDDFITMPMIESKNQNFLVEGTRKFYLGWTGGCQPYEVQVSCNGTSLQGPEINQVQQEVSFPEHSFKQGESCDVSITDVNHKDPTTGSFTIVSKGNNKLLDQNSGEILSRVTQLAKEKWFLEAYQQISQLQQSQMDPPWLSSVIPMVKQGLKQTTAVKKK